MRLLLIEDDEILGDGIMSGLREFGYSVDWVGNLSQARSALMTVDYDAMVLDLNLPDGSGLELLKELRNDNRLLPVMILTARDTVEDKINGLDTGADDYLIKPFDLDEMAARLRALIRRNHGRVHPLLKHNNIVMDVAAHQVSVNDTPLELSAREFSLLQLLMENSGKVMSKTRIEDKIYSWDDEIESNSIEVHIHNLRKKLGMDSIKTIRGVGYVIK